MRRFLLVLVMCCVASLATAALLDDFEGYDMGTIGDVTGGVWTGAANANIVMPVLGNKILDTSGNNEPARRPLGALAIPDADTQTTVFFRAMSPTLTNPDTLIGVTDNAAPSSYSHMQAYIQFTSGSIRARNGGSITSLVPFTVGEWYNIWIVVNNSANTYDVYINQGSANATGADQYATGFSFRYTSANSLITFANVYGDGCNIDDVYVTTGLDLTNPPAAVTPPPADDLTDYLWDAELPVENGGFALPGTSTPEPPGWDSNNTPYSGDTHTYSTSNNTDGDGWCWSQDIRTSGDNGPFWQITANPMVEGVTYTFTADVQGRWNCDGVTMSVVTGPYTGSDPNAPAGGGDPNIAIVSNPIVVGGNDVYYTGSVSYTATAADAGKLIGISFQGTSTTNIDNSWMRIDNVHLYTGYVVVHGPQDPTPANEAGGVVPGTIALSWTPSNDPNIVSQTLYTFVDDYLNFADIASYNSVSGTSIGAGVSTANVSAATDQYVIWRVDTVIDANTFTGETWYFVTQFTDEVPVITPGSGWLTYVGGTMPTVTADVNDFGEGDVADADVVWSVDTPWEPVNGHATRMIERTGASGADPNMTKDFLGMDDRDDGGYWNPMAITLSGVPAGTYTWTSYHGDVADINGSMDITVVSSGGTTTTEGFEFDNYVTDPNVFTQSGIVTDGSDITLKFYQVTGILTICNGFVLSDGVNPDLAIDFSQDGDADVGIGAQCYYATDRTLATFDTQYFDALGTTGIGVTPSFGPAVDGATVSVTKTSSDPLAPTASFTANHWGDYTVRINATDRGGSLGDQAATEATLVVRVAGSACSAGTSWQGIPLNAVDLNDDCLVDLTDFALLAAQWLDDIRLTGEPIAE